MAYESAAHDAGPRNHPSVVEEIEEVVLPKARVLDAFLFSTLKLIILVAFLAYCAAYVVYLWAPQLFTAAHAQAVGGLGDPQTFFQSVVTYAITLGRSITAIGAMWKACRIYMGHYDFNGLGMLAGGAAVFFGVPVLLGVGG